MKTIFFDLDGVLADFVRGALAIHGHEDFPISDVRWDFCSQIGFKGTDDPEFWAPLGRSFWSNLPVCHDGLALLAAAEVLVGQNNIGILTSLCATEGCGEGKQDWIDRVLPAYSRRLIMLGNRKSRTVPATVPAKALLAAPGKILLDDHDPNVASWALGGGEGISIPRPWNICADICDLGGRFRHDDVHEALVSVLRYP